MNIEKWIQFISWQFLLNGFQRFENLKFNNTFQITSSFTKTVFSMSFVILLPAEIVFFVRKLLNMLVSRELHQTCFVSNVTLYVSLVGRLFFYIVVFVFLPFILLGFIVTWKGYFEFAFVWSVCFTFPCRLSPVAVILLVVRLLSCKEKEDSICEKYIWRNANDSCRLINILVVSRYLVLTALNIRDLSVRIPE